jgi:hypothetical protein
LDNQEKSCCLLTILFQLQPLMGPRIPGFNLGLEYVLTQAVLIGIMPSPFIVPRGLCRNVYSLLPNPLSQGESNRLFKQLDHRMMPRSNLSTRCSYEGSCMSHCRPEM